MFLNVIVRNYCFCQKSTQKLSMSQPESGESLRFIENLTFANGPSSDISKRTVLSKTNHSPSLHGS